MFNQLIVLAQFGVRPFSVEGPFNLASLAFSAVLALVVLAGIWKVFEKAGKPGWAALIPIYNTYVLIKIAGYPGWWLLGILIPLLNFVLLIVVCLGVAERFSRSFLFGLGLAFLPVIFFPILGFDSSRYEPKPTEVSFG